MRCFLPFLPFLAAVMPLHADSHVYVSMAPEQKIQLFRLDGKDGKLTPVEALAVDGAPGSLATDPEKKFLFASLRTTSSLASFRIDPATGKLTHLSTAPLPKGENAAFVGTDRTGRWLISASYMAGKVVVHRLAPDGKIEMPAVQTIKTTTTAHAFAADPENRWVFVPHVTPNAIHQFRFDAKTGKLTEAGKAFFPPPPPPDDKTKFGTRHLAFHPTLPLAFTSDEEGSSISSYRFDPEEGLKPQQCESTLPPDFKGKNTTAEVKVHPSGKYVWVSNRGHDSLAGFAIDPKGKLTPLGQTPTEKTPRSFEITPDGRFLLGAGEGSGKLAVFRVDEGSGKLERIATQDVGKSLTWVMAIAAGGK